MRRFSILLAFVLGGIVLASACVGDDEGNTAMVDGDSASPQPDAIAAGDDASGNDAGGDAGACKTCNGSCVDPADPTHGCAAASCDPCPALPHASAKCAEGACALGVCDVGYDDLDI